MSIQHRVIRHDDNGVKLHVALLGIHRCELMRCPGNGVGLARTCTVLNKIGLPRPFRARHYQQLVDHHPLVVAREDHDLLLGFMPNAALYLPDYKMHETPNDAQQIIRQQHLVP